MRISDWSSDVCSSDLIKAAEPVVDRRNQFLHRFGIAYVRGLRQNLRSSRLVYGGLRRLELFLVAAADCHACAQSHRKEGGGLAHAASTVVMRIRCPDSRSSRNTVSRLRSEEHTSELQSLMRISYAVFCLKKKTN